MSQDYAEYAERPQTLWMRVKSLLRLLVVGGPVVGAVVFLVLYVVQDVHLNVAIFLACAADFVVSLVLLISCAVYGAVKDSRRTDAPRGAEHDAIGG